MYCVYTVSFAVLSCGLTEQLAFAVQVMKAINNNSYSQLQNAVGFAPRGERSNWVLIVKAGL